MESGNNLLNVIDLSLAYNGCSFVMNGEKELI